MASPLTSARPRLLRLTKTDPCPQVRHRAHLLLAVLAQGSLAAAARATGVSAAAIGRWRDRFLAAGRAGLRDRARRGRPGRVDAAADQLIDEALATSPMDYGYPVALWGLVDLADLLARQRQIQVGTEALSRHLKKRGYVYRRPRHDLRERQNEDAIASARHTLEKLQKKGLIAPDTACSIWMNAISTPIPSWQRCGNDGDPRTALPPPGATSGPASSARSTTARGR